MRAPMNCKLVGLWRIVEADIWDRQHLDLSGRRRSSFERTGAAKSPSARCKPASTSNTAGIRSDSPGKASTKWMKSPATDQPNCSMTARSRSNSPITTATKPFSKPHGILLQQPASAVVSVAGESFRSLWDASVNYLAFKHLPALNAPSNASGRARCSRRAQWMTDPDVHLVYSASLKNGT